MELFSESKLSGEAPDTPKLPEIEEMSDLEKKYFFACFRLQRIAASVHEYLMAVTEEKAAEIYSDFYANFDKNKVR